MIQQEKLERLARVMYKKTCKRTKDPDWAGVLHNNKVTLLYGPPMVRPDVALVSFQGGCEDRSASRQTWPERLLYLNDDYRCGRILRCQFGCAGLGEMLEKRTVAMAACFPEAPGAQADKWSRGKSGPRAEWRKFSSDWVRRMLQAMRPRTVLVFGTKASEVLELADAWCDREYRDSDRHLVYGRAAIEGCPAVYCHHLSQGASGVSVQKCLHEVKRIVDGDEP